MERFKGCCWAWPHMLDGCNLFGCVPVESLPRVGEIAQGVG